MSRRCLVIDLDRCSGCDGCIVSCKFENNINLGVHWNRVAKVGPMGEYPEIQMYWLPLQCQQCQNAPCLAACPTGATYRDENGVVLVDKETCIGCETCVLACPYGARMLNPDTNVVEKCTLCNQLTATSDGNENPADTEDPAHAVPPCVHNCSTGARFFGDLDDPESAASKAIAEAGGIGSENVHSLPDPNNAMPSTLYILSPKIAEWQEIL